MGSGPGVPKLLHHNGKVRCPLTVVTRVCTVNVVLRIRLAISPSMLTCGQGSFLTFLLAVADPQPALGKA